MPPKKAKTGQQYEVTGKKFIWHPLDENDEQGNLAEVVLPLRIKLGAVRSISLGGDLDAAAMFQMVELLAPGQAEAVDEMDVNDFQTMFTTWQTEYEKLSGATLGE